MSLKIIFQNHPSRPHDSKQLKMFQPEQARVVKPVELARESPACPRAGIHTRSVCVHRQQRTKSKSPTRARKSDQTKASIGCARRRTWVGRGRDRS